LKRKLSKLKVKYLTYIEALSKYKYSAGTLAARLIDYNMTNEQVEEIINYLKATIQKYGHRIRPKRRTTRGGTIFKYNKVARTKVGKVHK
jgi:hypothetical protein